jgi:ankyrin repeat protein
MSASDETARTPCNLSRDAARHSGAAHVEAAIAAGANVNARDDMGATALMHAVAIDDHGGIVKSLLLAGADANAVDDSGTTALSFAVAQGEHAVPAVQALLAAGADVDIKNADGRTALFYACVPVLPLLVAAGASPELAQLREPPDAAVLRLHAWTKRRPLLAYRQRALDLGV